MKTLLCIVLVVMALVIGALSHEADLKRYYEQHGCIDKNATLLNWSTK